jgi:hypothetical protein
MEEEKQTTGIKKYFNIKLTKWDVAAIIILIIFIIVVSIPTWFPQGDCEVARAAYKCDTFEIVMIENCNYWGTFDCDTDADVSLEQIEWYIGNLCEMQNKYHNTGLECSNLKRACNQVVGEEVC